MQGFSQNGGIIKYISYDEASLQKTLKPQVYTVAYNQMTGFYLVIDKASYDTPLLFGDVQPKVDRIFAAFDTRETGTGALFTGDKGSGKTLLAKVIANQAIKRGLPVVVINQPFTGDAFNELINAIGECVVIFDEIAKVYKDKQNDNNESHQDGLLTFLDGLSSSSKRILLFTENNEYHIEEFMRNRPGRILYHYRFGKLDEKEITDMCTYGLTNKEHIEDIIKLSRTMHLFSYDILTAIIEESNRAPELSIDTFVSYLNIDIPDKVNFMYEIDQVLVSEQPTTVVTKFVNIDCKAMGNLPNKDGEGKQNWGIYLYERCKVYEDEFSTVFKDNEVTCVAHKIPKETTDYTKYTQPSAY